jgi:hypothetical protein
MGIDLPMLLLCCIDRFITISMYRDDDGDDGEALVWWLSLSLSF